MKKYIFLGFCLSFIFFLGGCETAQEPKIGVSISVGSALRGIKEAAYMEEKAKELGIDIDVRIAKSKEGKTQEESCIELVDSGISVLILRPTNSRPQTDRILSYAKKRGVKVIIYARPILNKFVDLFIGYDTYRIGQNLAIYLSEKAYKGDIAFLKGDPNDMNAMLMYDGSMTHFRPLLEQGDLNCILDAFIPGWSAEAARKTLREAILKNGGKIDGVYAQNDTLAGAAADVIQEMGIKNHVVITGMDAELNAIKRIVAEKQDITVYMELEIMAYIAVEQAYKLAAKEKPAANSKMNHYSESNIDAYLVNGKVITKENLDALLIEGGVYTHEQVYGQ